MSFFLKEKILLALSASISSILFRRKPSFFSLECIYFLVQEKKDSIRGILSDLAYSDSVEKITKNNISFYRITAKGKNTLEKNISFSFSSKNSKKNKKIYLTVLTKSNKKIRQKIKYSLDNKNFAKINSSLFLSLIDPKKTLPELKKENNFPFLTIEIPLNFDFEDKHILKNLWPKKHLEYYQKSLDLLEKIKHFSFRTKKEKSEKLLTFFKSQILFYQGLKIDPCLPKEFSQDKITPSFLNKKTEDCYKTIYPKKLTYVNLSNLI